MLLARHGNTFAAGETPYMVGRQHDLPLTIEGEAQATALAACLQRSGIRPDLVLCGNLQRTRRMADIVCTALGVSSPLVDDRLTELDYGGWSGLTTAEIKARFGNAEYEAWENGSEMPANQGWQPALPQLQAGLHKLIDSLAVETVLAISSNGILRFVPGLLGIDESLLPAAHLKVKTGHICGFSSTAAGWQLSFWNQDPTNLPKLSF